MTDDLVARLRRDEAQLREYLRLARKFGGDLCKVYIKSPDVLLLDLGEAISKIETAEARVRELEAHLAETQERRRQWQEASVRDRAALAEAYERCAKVAEREAEFWPDPSCALVAAAAIRGSWMVMLANDGEALADQFGFEQKWQARCGGRRTD